jgi:hypothetical protein
VPGSLEDDAGTTSLPEFLSDNLNMDK